MIRVNNIDWIPIQENCDLSPEKKYTIKIYEGCNVQDRVVVFEEDLGGGGGGMTCNDVINCVNAQLNLPNAWTLTHLDDAVEDIIAASSSVLDCSDVLNCVNTELWEASFWALTNFNIDGLIAQGSNVTITGTGTTADPYIINSSWGGGWGGDVTWPASSIDDNFASFNGTGGDTIQDSGYNATSFTAANAPITAATKTKITYDAKGLVTAGADATTADIAASTDKNYVTDAQQTIIAATTASYTTADETKVDYITVSAPVNLDTMATAVAAMDQATILKGTWDASAGTFPGAGVAQAGWTYIVSVAGTVNSVAFAVGDRILAIVDNASTSTYAANWFKLDYTDQVLSVASKTGTVTLDTNDVTDTTNKRYVTDAEKTKLSNTSGTNTGDNATNTQYSGLAASKANVASPTFTGTVTLPTTQLGESSIKLDAALWATESRTGITTVGVLGGTVTTGDLVYMNSSGNWVITDGVLDGTDTSFNKQLGICLAGGANTNPTEILLYGKVRSAAIGTFTPAVAVYMSNTDGDVTATKPTTSNHAVRIVGFAISANELMFNPSNDYLVNV